MRTFHKNGVTVTANYRPSFCHDRDINTYYDTNSEEFIKAVCMSEDRRWEALVSMMSHLIIIQEDKDAFLNVVALVRNMSDAELARFIEWQFIDDDS